MSDKYNILILGASYGSLLATKMVFAGHDTTLVCLPAEAELINEHGAIVRLPVRGLDSPVELCSRDAPGKLTAIGPGQAVPGDYDLVCLAMQEPQYRAPEIRAVLTALAESGVPCMSIMNMPPLPYLARIPGLDTSKLEGCYSDASVWSGIDPDLMTLASPDPQAFRPPDEPVNVLQVGLPTNFKVARFAADEHTAMLKVLEADIEGIRLPHRGSEIELPVKLRVHDSVFVPLAKWSMLLTGNYRCVEEETVRPIAEAVHTDVDASRAVYTWVSGVCQTIGAAASDLVPFDKYAAAAKGLLKPSSAARALAAGAPNIERVDLLVQAIGALNGTKNDEVDASCRRVNAWIERNRR